jgi:hypothetical protein
MATTPAVSSAAGAQLQQLSPYAQAAFWAKLAQYDAAFYGGIEFHPANAEVKPELAAENPRFVYQGTVTRVDTTATTAVDALAGPTSVRGRGPVRTFAPATPLEFLAMARYGYKKTEPELVAELAENFGKGAARFAKTSLYQALTGVIAKQSTGGQHLYDLTGLTVKTLTLSRLIYAKSLMGDRGSDAVAFVVHSAGARSLSQDIVSGSNSGGLIRVFVESKEDVGKGLEAIGGMRLCVDDDTPAVLVTAGSYNYRNFILCPGSCWVMPGIDSPLLTVTPDLIERSVRSKRVTIEGLFAVGVYGMDWALASKANPTDAELYASTYWAEAFSFDHRDVGVCEVYSRDG